MKTLDKATTSNSSRTTNTKTSNAPMLRVADAAEALRTSPNYLYRLIRAGAVPGARRLNKHVLVPRDWVEQRRQERDEEARLLGE